MYTLQCEGFNESYPNVLYHSKNFKMRPSKSFQNWNSEELKLLKFNLVQIVTVTDNGKMYFMNDCMRCNSNKRAYRGPLRIKSRN